MRTTTRTFLVAGCVLALAACTGEGSGSSTTAPPSTTPGTTPATPAATASPEAPATPGDVPADVFLPEAAWAPVAGPRQESRGITDWRLPEACAAGIASTALDMATVTQGDGELEAQVGVQQVAVFADADAAVAEADRLAAAIDGCQGTAADGSTAYVREPLEVGAQGLGLATDYYGASAEGAVDDGALGSYLALTRRGTAVTLVALEGGESTVGTARETVTGHAGQAWELLCRYDSAGCA
ncbi:hypothetical protein [Actinotalea subterranea]|uniref:hypothetical protein n=1 Tax=Actinotalea subterranea TaxID=2607497 RepID=UPI0011EE0031|nr:hypothetical protein [Actinotalea subterranea]